MNKNKQHNQIVFLDMVNCVLHYGCTNYIELANALTSVGVRNSAGNPYTANNLRKLVHTWNSVPEEDDFRQDLKEIYLPDDQTLYDMGVDEEFSINEKSDEELDEKLFSKDDVKLWKKIIKRQKFMNPTVTPMGFAI